MIQTTTISLQRERRREAPQSRTAPQQSLAILGLLHQKNPGYPMIHKEVRRMHRDSPLHAHKQLQRPDPPPPIDRVPTIDLSISNSLQWPIQSHDRQPEYSARPPPLSESTSHSPPCRYRAHQFQPLCSRHHLLRRLHLFPTHSTHLRHPSRRYLPGQAFRGRYRIGRSNSR